MNGIEGRQFVVTGAAGGIGSACVRQLCGLGASVLMVDIDAERLRSVHAALPDGSEATAHNSPLATPRDAAAALDAAGRPVFGLIHMAGLYEPDPLDPEDHSAYDRALGSSLTNGYDLGVAFQARRDRDAVSRIVFCASGAARKGVPGRVAYSVAKAGVVGLTRGLSRQYAPHTLVNAVAPNAIRTPMTDTVFKERGDAILSTIPLGRFGEADEIASVVTFLCSDGATYITGQTINVDGGVWHS